MCSYILQNTLLKVATKIHNEITHNNIEEIASFTDYENKCMLQRNKYLAASIKNAFWYCNSILQQVLAFYQKQVN